MTTQRDDPEWGGLEVAIEGEGLTPADVSIRHLAQLLEATAAALDAVAKEQGIEAPRNLSLVSVRKGSALYAVETRDGQDAIRELYNAAKSRGKQSSLPVRHALARLNGAGRIGSIRLVPISAHGKRAGKPIYVAPPVEIRETHLDEEKEVHGRIVSVAVGRDRMVVRIKLDQGGTDEFSAEPDVAEQAARLFNKRVRARVTYLTGESQSEPGILQDVDAWEDADLLEVLADIRDQLDAGGIRIDMDSVLAEDEQWDPPSP